MRLAFPNMPDWAFELDEVTPGVYRLVGTGPSGSAVARLATDHDDLVRYAKFVGEAAATSHVPVRPRTLEFPELPGWMFDINEVSANVYEVLGVGPHGESVQRKGIEDAEDAVSALLDQAKAAALMWKPRRK